MTNTTRDRLRLNIDRAGDYGRITLLLAVGFCIGFVLVSAAMQGIG